MKTNTVTIRNNEPDNFTKIFEIHHTDGKRLHNFIEAELAAYNTMVTHFIAVLRRNPDMLAKLSDSEVELFATMCRSGSRKTNDTALSEAKQIMFEVSQACASLDPATRYGMGKEIISFFRNQAIIASNSKFMGDDGLQYRQSIMTLEFCTIFQKNHVQINRSSCKIKADGKGGSYIYIPYCNEPIHVDTNVANSKWTMLVISNPLMATDPSDYNHTQHVRRVWLASFKTTTAAYLPLHRDHKYTRKPR
jgi:hypothetical protein